MTFFEFSAQKGDSHMRYYTDDERFTIAALIRAFEGVGLKTPPEMADATGIEVRRIEDFFDRDLLTEDGISEEELEAIERVTKVDYLSFFPNQNPIRW